MKKIFASALALSLSASMGFAAIGTVVPPPAPPVLPVEPLAGVEAAGLGGGTLGAVGLGVGLVGLGMALSGSSSSSSTTVRR